MGSLLSQRDVREFTGIDDDVIKAMQLETSEFARLIKEYVTFCKDASKLEAVERSAAIADKHARIAASLSRLEVKSNDVLDEGVPPEKLRRLLRVYVQVYGMASLKNELIADYLKLSSDSRLKISRVMDSIKQHGQDQTGRIQKEKSKATQQKLIAQLKLELEDMANAKLKQCITESESRAFTDLVGDPLNLEIISKIAKDREAIKELAEGKGVPSKRLKEISGSEM